jgi:enamine deaminase RidA (YjgF/YER057c/UK114 family)
MKIRWIILSCLVVLADVVSAATARYVNDGAAAVVPAHAPLVFTRQVFLPEPSQAPNGIALVLQLAQGGKQEVVRLHVIARTQEAADAAHQAIRNHYPAGRCPPVSFVIGDLPEREAAIAIDAVAIRAGAMSKPATRSSLLFISGQAEKGASPAEAAAKTMASLVKTLSFAGARPSDVLQVRCFLNPINAAASVTSEIENALRPSKIPIVFVEWKSSPGLPVEIELVATAPPPEQENPPAVEYLTQPEATASPIFSRIARVNRGDLIFIGGLYSSEAGDGQQQVLSIFDQLEKLATANGSDLRHLVKATYYVSDDDASAQLNALRPKFYDSKRPPAASKATVPGVGMKDRSITIDMIAVTTDSTS